MAVLCSLRLRVDKAYGEFLEGNSCVLVFEPAKILRNFWGNSQVLRKN